MSKNRKNSIVEVSFTYIGTDDQFNEFLKMMIHDYLAVDHPYTQRQENFVDKVDSHCA